MKVKLYKRSGFWLQARQSYVWFFVVLVVVTILGCPKRPSPIESPLGSIPTPTPSPVPTPLPTPSLTPAPTSVQPENAPPVIIIFSPEDKSITMEDSVEITGRIEDTSEIAFLAINGESVPLKKKNEFSYQVNQLEAGQNSITITAWDIDGNVAEEKIQIIQFPHKGFPSPTPSPFPTPSGVEYPQFPWPPPQASAQKMIPSEVIGEKATTINDVVQNLETALNLCGYVEKSYYSIPDGFVIVTRLEQINDDGAPKEESERWVPEIQPVRQFSLKEYLKAFFFARKGYYRIIVFVFSPHPFSQTNSSISPSQAENWLSSGLNVLPQEISQKEYSNNYTCTALIYEFEQYGIGEAPKIRVPGRLSGETHLTKAQLWKTLKK